MIPASDFSTAQRPTELVGRFAPSPTGPLHAGSLVAALASYLDARAHGGRWLIRIDDIDPPRAMPGANTRILKTLAAHGLQHDGEVDYQSSHSPAYDEALHKLGELGLLFRCVCTRSTLGPMGTCIGDCAQRCEADVHPEKTPYSVRVKVRPDAVVTFNDLILGPQMFQLGTELNNFIVRRRDGLYAYQLAAAVDDAAPTISHVIRGRDLLDSTPRQLYLQQCLNLVSPAYGHLPLVVDAEGTKLSKQTGAPALDDDTPMANLRYTLNVLGQPEPPPDITDCPALLTWSCAHWSRKCIPR